MRKPLAPISEMKNQKRAYLCAGTAVFFWSTVAAAFKISLRHLDVLSLLFYASAVSTGALFVLLLARGKLSLLLSYRPRDYLRSMMLGFLNPFLYYTILFEAYDRLPAQEAQPLNYTWAIVLALLSVPLLGQRLQLRSILGIGVSYAGAWVIATHGRLSTVHLSDSFGVGLALGSAVIWALFWIFNVRDDRDEDIKLFLNFGFGMAFILTALLAGPGLVRPGSTAILGAAYAGLFEMGITFVLWLKALQLSESAARIGQLIYLSPFLSLVFIHYLVGETILPSTVFGLFFIVAGIAIQPREREIPSDA
jgi:drug/metabolite transporter (DMT)-like permease